MGVAYGAMGSTPANGSTSCTPNYPTGISAATSKLYCLVASGASGEPTPTMPNGWTNIFTYSGGSGVTYGDSVGNRRVTIFKKDTVTGSESGSVTVSNTGGNTMRAAIIRVEVGSGNGISEQWQAAADAVHDLSWSVTAPGNINWRVGQLLIEFTAQCQDTATVSSKSLTATGVTFGTLTNIANTAVTTGNDHRYVIDYATVNACGVPSAPVYSHTNSANASGPTGFLVLTEQISSIAAALQVFSSNTSTKDPDIGPGRTVERFSRLGLLRGTPARKYGKFGTETHSTDVSAALKVYSSSTATKIMATDVTGRIQVQSSVTAERAGGTGIVGRFATLSTSTATKIGFGVSTSEILAPKGSTTYTSIKPAAATGRLLIRSTNDSAKRRTVQTPFSRLGLLRGTPSRRNGNFARYHTPSDVQDRIQVRTTSTASKIGVTNINTRISAFSLMTESKRGLTDIAARIKSPQASDTTSKTGITNIATAIKLASAPTASKTGTSDQAARTQVYSHTTYMVAFNGRTVVRFSTLGVALTMHEKYGSFARSGGVNLISRIKIGSTLTASKSISTSVASMLRILAANDSQKVMPANIAGRFDVFSAIQSNKLALTDLAAQLMVRSSSTYLRILGPTYDLLSQLQVRSESTATKISEEGDIDTMILVFSQNSSSKIGVTDVRATFAIHSQMSYAEGPTTSLFSRFNVFSSSTFEHVILPTSFVVFGRVLVRSENAGEKIGGTDIDTTFFVFSRSDASKTALTDIDTRLMVRSTMQPPIIENPASLPASARARVGGQYQLRVVNTYVIKVQT